MNLNVGAAITDAMEDQFERDMLRLLLYEMVASGKRIQARLEAKAAEDPEWADLAEFHRESLRQVGIDP